MPLQKIEWKETLNYEVYCALRRSVGWTLRPEPQTRAALAQTPYCVTAWQNGEPAGMARLIGDGLYWFLVDVAVAPPCQGQGVGRGLVDHALAFIRARLGAGETASLELVANPGTEPFYAALGFSAVPNGSCGHGMVLSISKS